MTDPVNDLVAAFGLRSRSDLARLFEVGPSAVSNWRTHGLPAAQRLKALKLARERGVDLPDTVVGGAAGRRGRRGFGSEEGPGRAPEPPSSGGRARADWVQIDRRGRLVLPPAALEALGVKPGDKVLLESDGSGLRVRSLRAVVSAVQASVRRFVPDDVSLVDELIAERRREAERE